MKIRVWLMVLAACLVSDAAEKKSLRDEIPRGLQQGMVGEPRSVMIATEDQCDQHASKKKVWESFQKTGIRTFFVKWDYGYQILMLAGSPEGIQKARASAVQVVGDHDAMARNPEMSLCNHCVQMKLMAELKNYSLEAVNVKDGAMILVMTEIPPIVSDLQKYGGAEFQWLDRMTRPATEKK